MGKSYAEFYKCALQVNPYSYIQYRGENHEINEDEYNKQILFNCEKNGIKIVGLANHGDCASSENLRNLLTDNGITVFPGFEIATAEKIHIVCLFSEKTEDRSLERYLGVLGIANIEDGISPSEYTCLEIARRIDELNGFWFAAHVTSDNGILKIGKMNNIWTNAYLKAAQIPSTRENIDPRFKNIINNKEPQYKRERMVAYINAKDVSKPEDLDLQESSCLVKMSEISFDCFKQAFNDPESRVKLVTELDENHHSVIEKVEVFGGYLDGLKLNLSPNLNTFIGGRGTGKSTLLELIRYALEITPKSTDSKKTLDSLIKNNLGIENGRVEISISSNIQHGTKFTIVKRYNDPVVIKNTNGKTSNLNIEDILPTIEFYGQNEIIGIVDNNEARLRILDRFLPLQEEFNCQKDEIKRKIKKNRDSITDVYNDMDELNSEVHKLPSLLEKKKTFEELGVTSKLGKIELISKEEEYFNLIITRLSERTNPLSNFQVPLSISDSSDWLHEDLLISCEDIVNTLNDEICILNLKYEKLVNDAKKDIDNLYSEWKIKKDDIDREISQLIKEIPEIYGATGKSIAQEFKSITSNINRIKPLNKQLEEKEKILRKLQEERRNLLEGLRKINDDYEETLRGVIKSLNKKKLKGKVRIQLQPNANRENLKKFLTNLPGIAEKSLEWIDKAEDLTIPSLYADINQGSECLFEKYKSYGLTKAKAEVICNMTIEQKLELEEIELMDIIDIQLNIDSNSENYKSLDLLSKGQQCTAILNILLLENKDPLIIDQPEDNLDNAFIADNIVNELRNSKMNRQFIFATHNANIPVFGDAELIGVLQERNGQGEIKENLIGSVDSFEVRRAVIQTLEGGDYAFKMRKEKYNL
ncbi:hypothetical protein P421_13755 [Heyndrickxia coagulans P38]|uniref:TrlF family AAA-like ATPase n=1 Tax=Heyndrickxia coagulans TaxID=1398 RepID=UPI000558FA54|nr:AAA family ATPase [Heyndrickxia coagulans]KGT37737.1 hypothetical protein P421_13755 [Heyndrickxia coagulans P38]